jgi:ribosomal protein L19E
MATVNKDFRIKHGLIVEGTSGTINGNNILTDNDTTDVLDEGTTNLYFTDSRVKDVLTGSTQENISITVEDGVLTIAAENGIADSTTDDLDEGSTNLYFTSQRAQDAVTENLSTDDLDEGTTNLYFTDSRVKDVLTGSTQENISITVEDGVLTIAAENGIADSTTDDLEQGTTNLYFTEEAARGSISGGAGIDYDTETGIVDVDFGYGLELDETNKLIVDTVEIATKEYVNEVAQGLKVRGSVEAATTEDLDGVYDNGTNGVDATITLLASATLDIDGWTSWSELDGILVKDQNNPEENGRYFVFQVGDEVTPWILKRCVDCDTAEEIPGSFVFAQHGNTYGGTGWVATVENSDTFEVGTDPITWLQFSGAGTYVGGTGISIDGTEISVDFTEFDTDSIDEGSTNLYFTSQRAQDAVTENLSTDDLDEGTTNLYFTDQRAVDAIEAVVPKFNAVEIKTALQDSNSTVGTTAENTYTAYSFDSSEYRSGKFLVKMSAGSHTEVLEILLTLDTSNNIAITEYAIVGTNGSLGVVSATYSDGDVLLTVEPVNNNTAINVYATLLV